MSDSSTDEGEWEYDYEDGSDEGEGWDEEWEEEPDPLKWTTDPLYPPAAWSVRHRRRWRVDDDEYARRVAPAWYAAWERAWDASPFGYNQMTFLTLACLTVNIQESTPLDVLSARHGKLLAEHLLPICVVDEDGVRLIVTREAARSCVARHRWRGALSKVVGRCKWRQRHWSWLMFRYVTWKVDRTTAFLLSDVAPRVLSQPLWRRLILYSKARVKARSILRARGGEGVREGGRG